MQPENVTPPQEGNNQGPQFPVNTDGHGGTHPVDNKLNALERTLNTMQANTSPSPLTPDRVADIMNLGQEAHIDNSTTEKEGNELPSSGSEYRTKVLETIGGRIDKLKRFGDFFRDADEGTVQLLMEISAKAMKDLNKSGSIQETPKTEDSGK